MAAPTTLTIFFASTSQTIPIPQNSNFNDFALSIARNGFWYTDSSTGLTFVPGGQIVKITAA